VQVDFVVGFDSYQLVAFPWGKLLLVEVEVEVEAWSWKPQLEDYQYP